MSDVFAGVEQVVGCFLMTVVILSVAAGLAIGAWLFRGETNAGINDRDAAASETRSE